MGRIGKLVGMSDLPLHILTDAGFTSQEADSIVDALIKGTDLHAEAAPSHPVNIDDLPTGKKEALERFNLAVAADG